MPPAMHKLLEPLAWLKGTWRTEDPASGSYPTIKDFNYCEEISFVSVGQPMFNYTARSWHPETKKPMHLETGFLKVYEKIDNEDSTKVELILAHNFGLSTIEQGYISDKSIHLKTNGIVKSERSKLPHVTKMTRELRLLDNNHLEQVLHMATTNTPTLHKHLLAKYVKLRAKMQMKNLPLNEMLHVLAWLEGIWITDEPAIVQFPTMKQSINYYDQINITSLGQPWLNYVAQSWHAETGDPMHRETGFVQITPDNKITFYLMNPLDMVTVEQGELTNNNMTIDLKSTKILAIGMNSIPSFSQLKETRRVYNFDGNHLELIFYMATEKTPVLTEHLRAKYRKML